ncbi:uncharacterized protein LOC123514822 [Portunus trituberculatus]|uniref:uncharacterized protein LOC123514822 n=1 Tax=Portunus trituberculatus TaxID=210409 RepID=UPI001E1CB095|nr:uncharacterized protein LOC123514822 [Portunus trituberculatus]
MCVLRDCRLKEDRLVVILVTSDTGRPGTEEKHPTTHRSAHSPSGPLALLTPFTAMTERGRLQEETIPMTNNRSRTNQAAPGGTFVWWCGGGLLHPRLSVAGEQNRPPLRGPHIHSHGEGGGVYGSSLHCLGPARKQPRDVFHAASPVMLGIWRRVKRR